MIISLNTTLDLKIFSPSEPIGIFIIFVGLVFTGMPVNTNPTKIMNIPMGSLGLNILRSKVVFREIIINKLIP